MRRIIYNILMLINVVAILSCENVNSENRYQKQVKEKFQYGTVLGSYENSWYTGAKLVPLQYGNGEIFPTGKQLKLELKEVVFDSIDMGKAEERFIHKSNSSIGHIASENVMSTQKKVGSIKLEAQKQLHFNFGENRLRIQKPKSFESVNAGRDEINIELIDVGQNLGGTFMSSVIEDINGNIWIGGFEGGTVLTPEYSSIIDFGNNDQPWIVSMVQDKRNWIWFCTDRQGLFVYNGIGACQVKRENGLKSDSIKYISIGPKGEKYILYSTGGISKIENNQLYDFSNDLIDTTVFLGMEIIGDQIILISEENLFLIEKEKIYTIQFSNRLNGFNQVKSITPDSLVIATDNELVSFSTNGFQKHTFPNSISVDLNITDFDHKNGRGVVSTSGSGLLIIEKGEVNVINESMGLSANFISQVIIDKSDNIWALSYGKGVNIIPSHSFSLKTNRKYYEDSRVMSIKNIGNEVYLSGYDGVLKIRNDSVFKVEFSNSTKYKAIYGPVKIDSKLWFSFSKFGLVSLDSNDNCTLFRKPDSESETNYFSYRRLDSDQNGNLWFGENTTHIMKGQKFYAVENFPKSKVNINEFTFTKTDSGKIYCAIYGIGVMVVEDDFFKIYSEREGLSSNNVASCTIDKFGNVWIANFKHGIDIISNDSIFHIDKNNGLAGNIVASVIMDQQENIWVSTSTGLSYIKYSEESQGWSDFDIVNFSTKDGLNGWDFHQEGGMVDSKGNYWVSGSGGVCEINPKLVFNENLSVNLVSLSINDNYIDFSEECSTSDIKYSNNIPFFNVPKNLVLESNFNHLTFHFGLNAFRKMHHLEYSHRIKTLNKAWSNPSNLSFVDYRNIPPGIHEFEVRVREKGSKWSEIKVFEFTINPPWYQTWWFRISAGLGIMLLFFGFYKVRTKQMRKRQEELEATVEERTREVVEQKDIIEEVHKEITDSINYAERIQRSFLATKELLDSNLDEYFVFFKPKDVVSGDFYWAGKLSNGNFAIVNADSTGHGVPGAIMSILNITAIEKAVEKGIDQPNLIFNEARTTIIERLKKDGSVDGGKDGMDASLISFNPEKTKMFYVAAHNPIWIIRSGELIEIKSEKMPVGKHDFDNRSFEGGEFELQKGDLIITITDGYQDQFGGEKGKKYKVKPLKRLLTEHSNLPINEQKQILENEFDSWKGSLEQVDDVCVIGVKIQ